MAPEGIRPTAGELELLSLLWEHGALSISEVHQLLDGAQYTTVQTRLNRLVDKQWAGKSKSGRQATRYEAVIQRESVTAPQLDTLVEQVAGGSVVPLVAHLVKDESLTNEQLAEIKRLIKEAEQRLQKGRAES